jgi:molybdate transport system ATP-binding protein
VSVTCEEGLEARLKKRIHESLTLDVSLKLGFEAGILFGPSGAGKTTLLRLISGLAKPDGGRVCLGGKVLFDSEERKSEPLRNRRIGMIFQDDRLFPHLSVAANIGFGLKGYERASARERLAEVAALCGVEKLLGRAPETLSGGERQRVGLARALAPRPQLLLCDEPVSALDLANRHALLEQLRKVQQTLAIPMLYVTHSPAEALALGSHLFHLRGGRIVAEGCPLDALSKSGRLPLGADTWEDVRNVFTAKVGEHTPPKSASTLELDGGPELIVPFLDLPSGTPVLVAVRADDILLSKAPLIGLSARNQIRGSVEQIVRHGPEAEVIVQTGKITWIASVVDSALEQLALSRGAAIHLIIKARSCRILHPEFSRHDS